MPPALEVRAHDQRVKLPHVASVGADAADPTEDGAPLVDGHAAYPSPTQRFAHLFEGGLHIRPGVGPVVLEPLDKEDRRLPDDPSGAGIESTIENRGVSSLTSPLAAPARA